MVGRFLVVSIIRIKGEGRLGVVSEEEWELEKFYKGVFE